MKLKGKDTTNPPKSAYPAPLPGYLIMAILLFAPPGTPT